MYRVTEFHNNYEPFKQKKKVKIESQNIRARGGFRNASLS